MALLLNGSTDYLTLSSALLPSLAATPFTFACWVKLASLPGTAQAMMSLSKTAGAVNIFQELYWDNANSKLTASAFDGTTSGPAASTATIADTTSWHHCCGVFTSSSSRAVYLDGAAVSSAVAVVTSATVLGLGVSFAGTATPISLMNGSIALPCIWNIALTQSDVSALIGGGPGGRGTDPRNIQPNAVISFSPLKAAPYMDIVSGYKWTVAGSPAQVADPFNILHQPITHGGLAE